MASGGVHARLDAGVHARLLDIGLDCSATLFMLCTAALAATLTRMGAGDDLPIAAAARRLVCGPRRPGRGIRGQPAADPALPSRRRARRPR